MLILHHQSYINNVEFGMNIYILVYWDIYMMAIFYHGEHILGCLVEMV